MKEENFRQRMMLLDLNKLQRKATKSFQLMRRMEEANKDGIVRCISCGKFGDYKTFDGGHFIQCGHKGTRFCSSNVWPQCKRCNDWLRGNHAAYRDALVKKFGKEEVERMEAQKDTLPPGMSYRELCIEILVYSKKVIKELKKKFTGGSLVKIQPPVSLQNVITTRV